MLQLVHGTTARDRYCVEPFDEQYDRLLESNSYDRLDTILRLLLREAYEAGRRDGEVAPR